MVGPTTPDQCGQDTLYHNKIVNEVGMAVAKKQTNKSIGIKIITTTTQCLHTIFPYDMDGSTFLHNSATSVDKTAVDRRV